MTGKRTILFVSALDFKEKSIQVILKTPEAYVERGWNVIYLVARDESKRGDYFYERVINVEGVEVVRFGYVLSELYGRCGQGVLRIIIGKLRSYLATLELARRALSICRSRHVDVVYGFGDVGVVAAIPAARLLGRRKRFVTRFLGSFVADMVQNRRYVKLLWNWESIMAMRIRSDLCIVTDDGTQGNKALGYVRSANRNVRFWTNGVDGVRVAPGARERAHARLGLPSDAKLVVSVSRLVRWKRVDRCIEIVSQAIKDHGLQDLHYAVVGDGEERARLDGAAESMGIGDHVHLLGALPNAEVWDWIASCDAFLSMYDVSNVGNPLLEAIRAHAIVLTLNNGDTGRWIEHGVNGFIYDIDDNLTVRAAEDLARVLTDAVLRNRLKEGIVTTERDKLWTWQQRMKAEVDEVSGLLEKDWICR